MSVHFVLFGQSFGHLAILTRTANLTVFGGGRALNWIPENIGKKIMKIKFKTDSWYIFVETEVKKTRYGTFSYQKFELSLIKAKALWSEQPSISKKALNWVQYFWKIQSSFFRCIIHLICMCWRGFSKKRSIFCI